MTGSLQIKNNKFYAVVNVYENNKRKPKWIYTGYTVPGNKKKAEQFLRRILIEYEEKSSIVRSDVTFSEYVRYWLKTVQRKVDEITFQGYTEIVKVHVLPFFEENDRPIQEITTSFLQNFIDSKSRNGRVDGKGGLSPCSVKKIKNVLNQTLNEAEKNGLIRFNPCKWLVLPKAEHKDPKFYSAKQMESFLEAIKNEPLYLLIKFTAYYGLRRSEVLGLKWDSVDFEQDMVYIHHTVVKVNTVIYKNKTKNESSRRSFPLIPELKDMLLRERDIQLINRKEFGNAYFQSDYIFVWADGHPFAPDYVSRKFSKLTIEYGFPKLNFHGIRHSCASILLSKGFTLKDVQEWLGHADIKMTANVYGHLDFGRKKAIAEGIFRAIS